uniref:HD/PDEase domain-containing protein n=1 Tax=Clytia hemisphaerica TaxID=252671 RepID=A0A7M5XK07_9CNID
MKPKLNEQLLQEHSTMTWKSFHDSVHGTIMLHPVLVAIIDTPQFQRLRDIKQLGVGYWVFPGACHNRFEHSIGTSYLCGEMLTTLKYLHQHVYKDPIDITDKDILCVKIAGLCHDLGHGPFSHLFDGPFFKRCKNFDKEEKWTHEQGSCELFDYMIKQNEGVRENLLENGIGEHEKKLIKAMILGENKEIKTNYRGQSLQKQFLFEIVSNKATGIDCDKFDYFARDTHHAGIRNSFDFNRYFKNVRILPVKNDEEKMELRICARDKEESNLYELFHIRWTLHRQVYQHKTVQNVEELLVRAMLLADEKFGISSSVKDMEKCTLMTDSIFYRILCLNTDDKDDIQKAQELLRRIQKRDLYDFCGEINQNIVNDNLGEDVLSKTAEKLGVDKKDIFVRKSTFNFGKGIENPLKEMKFCDKYGAETKPQVSNLSSLLPRSFEESRIRIYCKTKGQEKKINEAVKNLPMDQT